MTLILRRAQGHRPGHWGPDDYDVFDGEREVGGYLISGRKACSLRAAVVEAETTALHFSIHM